MPSGSSRPRFCNYIRRECRSRIKCANLPGFKRVYRELMKLSGKLWHFQFHSDTILALESNPRHGGTPTASVWPTALTLGGITNRNMLFLVYFR